MNASGEKFSTGRIGSLLVSTSDLPLEQVKKHFIKEWNDFTAGSEQADDVTFVLVEINARYRELVDCRNRGFKLLSAGDHTGAIVELRKALDIDPSDEKTNLYIGECYLNTRAYAGAVRHLVEYLNRNEIDANVWCHLAEAHFNLENYQEAHRAAQKALQFRNRFARAMEILAMSFKKLERYREANQIWKRLLAMDSGNEIALREMEESDDDVVK